MLTDKLLEKGYHVTGIDCFTPYYSKKIKEDNISHALKKKNFKLIRKDILNIRKFPLVDYVFHLAAQAGVRASWGKSFETYSKNNMEATQVLLEFYKESKIKKFVYASSSSVYGDAKLPMEEDSLLKPVSPYGVTKLAGENLCYLYFKNYGLPTVSLRYFTVYGERQRPDMAFHKFIKTILDRGKNSIYGDGEQSRDFTYVGDTVQGTILAAECDISGKTFNLGGGSRISVNDALKALQKIMAIDVEIEYLDVQKGDVGYTYADISKAKDILGYEPVVGLKGGLKRQVKWIGEIYPRKTK